MTTTRAAIEQALAAGPISKLAQRATDLHEKADMPWDDADELALSEHGLSEDALCDVIADFGLIDHDGVRLMSDQDIKNLARHVLVWSPLQIHHDAEKKALEDELVRVRAEMRRFMPLLERVAEGPFWDELTAGLGIGTINAYRAALSPTTTNG